VQDFTKLQVWQKSHQFTLGIYKITKDFPAEEKFGLISQLRRASCSIGSNLAEGCGRTTNNELARFIAIAQGSPKGYRFAYAFEVRYQLILARDLNYISPERFNFFEQKIIEISRMLNSLTQKLTTNN
jgi:four helix bundle protein